MRTRLLSLCLILTTFFVITLTSCNDDDMPTYPTTIHPRVVFVYMVAENNLSDMGTEDIEEMLQGCRYMSDTDRIVIYLDNAVKGKAPCFYEITKQTTARKLHQLTPTHTYREDFNSASPEILDMAMQFVYDHYPADSYGIVLWSHASGWAPYEDNDAKTRAFGVDTGNNSFGSWGNQMNIDDMATVLKKYSNIDFLLFDACFMQAIEAAYELKDATRYIMASPAEIPGPGAPYNLLISPMFSQPLDMDAVMSAYYTYYSTNLDYGVLLSVIDCGELENFTQVHSRIYHKYKDNITTSVFTNTLNYFNFDRWHKYTEIPDCYDMKGVMQQIVTDKGDLNEWLEAFKRIVPYSCATDTWYTDYAETYLTVNKGQYGGVSMYIEQDKYKKYFFYNEYPQTAWAKAIGLGI